MNPIQILGRPARDRAQARAAAVVLLAGLAVAVAPRARAQSGSIDPKFDPRHLAAPPLHAIRPVTPQRFKLGNGMTVFLLENHDLPIVAGEIDVRSTPTWIPDDKVGLGTITGEVIRSGGTATHSGDWLDDRLAAVGASIETNIGLDLASARFRCLRDDAPEVIGLFTDVVRHPAFPADKIELAKVSLRHAIASRNDEMIPLLVRVAGKAVYGASSFWARQPEYATVEAVTAEDCAGLYRKAFEPSRMVLAVYGDFSSADMKKRLERELGAWKGNGGAAPALPPTPAETRARLVFAPKEDVTQSGIILSNPGFRADDPDYPAMDVLQTALGGGFQSRLVNRIRTERGLAYATGAAAGEDYQKPGVFIAYSLTKSESTMVALDLLRDEVRKVTQAPLTDEELQIAKESVLNTFVFHFEEPSSVLFRDAFFEVAGYPQDFLQKYQQGVQAVTAAGVLEAARRKLHPDQMVAIVVGKEKDFDRPLDSAGLPVERVDLAIPPPPSKVKAGVATDASRAGGQALLRKAAELAGGSKAWADVRTVTMDQDQTLSMQGQSIAISSHVAWQLPDHWVAVQKLPMGEMKQGFDGTAGWMSAMGQVQDQPKVAEQVRERYERSFFRLFGHPESYELQELEPQTVDGVSYRTALVKSELVHDWTLFFSPDGSLARMESQGEGPQGPARLTEIYGDWKAEAGLSYPHASKVLVDGKPLLEGKVVAITLNSALEATAFQKP